VTSTGATRERIRAAVVLRSHGLHGEVCVEALGGDAARFARGLRLVAEGSPRVLTVVSSRAGSRGVLLRFAEIGDAREAATLRGRYLSVDLEDARRLGDDEWFVWQLVGLRAVTPEGDDLGTVVDVEAGVAHDVLVVESPGGTRLFPMVREFVRSVDLEAARITVLPWTEDAQPA